MNDDELLHDIKLFLDALPRDLGRGSLNGMRTQLLYKVDAALQRSMNSSPPAEESVFLGNLHYFFAQTDGTYAWPPGAVGDLLRQAKREFEERGKAPAAVIVTAGYKTTPSGPR